MPLKPPVSETDHFYGNDRATIELVEYGDYQCPHCARAHSIVKRLQEKLGDELKFIFRNFPLNKIHPDATLAAIATEAAARQDKYWQMHDIVFDNQDDLEEPALMEYANIIGLNMDQFEKDLADKNLLEKVENDFESGIRSGVNATPTFYINGEKYNNGWDGDRLAAHLKEKFGLG
jgi:protein-disulfide isomerase